MNTLQDLYVKTEDIEPQGDQTRCCAACGRKFVPQGRNASRQKYCTYVHFVNCCVCGAPVEINMKKFDSSSIPQYCSADCRKQGVASTFAQTMLDRYGFSNPGQVPSIVSKANASRKLKEPETTQKRLHTMVERYGATSAMGSPELRKKIEATNLAKYGETNPSKNAEIQQKIREIAMSEEFQDKYTTTALSHYGVARPSKLKEVQDKMRETSLERYGVACTLTTDYAKSRYKEACLSKYGVPNALQSDAAREKLQSSPTNKVSKLNQMVASILNDAGVTTSYELYLEPYWYDLEVVGANTVIEIDPSYTHSDLPNHWCSGVAPDYHLKKTEVAVSSGYRCVHMFDWDNLYTILDMFKQKQSIYARNCTAQKIDKKIASSFLSKYHLQGKSNGVKFACGLYYNSQLVSVMTFGKPRYSDKYEWELLRLCTHPDFRIAGGASKLFHMFEAEVHPSSIISYCDRAKFTGDVYTALGFTLHHTSPPAKVWSKDDKKITDNLLRSRGYDQLFNTDYGKGTSNEQLMVEHGWRSVYDCGQLVFTKVY